MDAVHFIRFLKELAKIFGEGGWRNDGNLTQAGLKPKKKVFINLIQRKTQP